MSEWVFKLEPGARLTVTDAQLAPSAIVLSGVISEELVQGFPHPYPIDGRFGPEGVEYEYEITVKATRKFTPGYYRCKAPRKPGQSAPRPVAWFHAPPWESGTAHTSPDDWERVKVGVA